MRLVSAGHVGLIPAHAGKTIGYCQDCQARSAHPRSRGENPPAVAWRAWFAGSSPLTRGKRVKQHADQVSIRLIPAHAGKTRGYSLVGSAPAAHPRSRGGNPPTFGRSRVGAGSSPLTRGKHGTCQPALSIRQLIPAHAGKTLSALAAGLWKSAHPRSRGENFASGALAVCRWGSSPLTRGKRRCPHGERAVRGLIPAHAGKTYRRWTAVSSPTAHPRSRGENVRLRPMCLWTTGSSPLTRGKLLTIL